jgi:hypothetical protein
MLVVWATTIQELCDYFPWSLKSIEYLLMVPLKFKNHRVYIVFPFSGWRSGSNNGFWAASNCFTYESVCLCRTL